MNKFVTTILVLCATVTSKAQTLQPVNLIKTKLSVVKTTINNTISGTSIGDMDIENKVQSSTVININISPINTDNAAIETTIKKLKMTGEAMGRKMEYDSDNPLTSTYAATEELNKIAGSSIKYYINKKGVVTSVDTTRKLGVSSKMNMMQFGGLSVGADCNMFFNIIQPVNVGDVWKDSSLVQTMKTINKYKFKSYENGLAIIEQSSTIVVDGEIEQMGMKVKSNQQGTIVGELIINPINLLVINRKLTTILEGTITAKRQTMPSKVTTEIVESVK